VSPPVPRNGLVRVRPRDRAPWRCRAPALPLTLTLTLMLTLMLSAAADRRHEPLSKPHIGISLD
jgi:hypothetical protein